MELMVNVHMLCILLHLAATCFVVPTNGLSARRADLPPVNPAAMSEELTPYLSQCSAEQFRSKDLDVIIYGATGFVGNLATEYLGNGHPDKPRWAIASDSAGLMFTLKNTLRGMPLPPNDTFYSDLNEQSVDNIDKFAKRARVILNFAGPFEENGGEHLIKAAVRNCAHYVDISTETVWNADILKKYDEVAEARGIAIVQSAGLHALPTDLLTVMAADKMAADGEGPPNTVKVAYVKLDTWPSSGNIATARAVKKHPTNADPYILAPKIPRESKGDRNPAGIALIGPDLMLQTYTGWYPGAEIDCPVARRSLFQRFPDARVPVGAYISVPDVMFDAMRFFGSPNMFLQPPPAWELGTPMAKVGPPEWMRKTGGLVGFSLATRGKRVVRYSLSMEGEPNSIGTAKMATELALGLAFGVGNKSFVGGYLTPALALGGDPLLLVERFQKVKGAGVDSNFMNVSGLMFDMELGGPRRSLPY